jgi:DNA (cytosine-5)-methyltransferase 1
MLNTIDLFAGCGGLTEGFKQSGHFKMLAAVEWDKDAHATLVNRLMHAHGYTDASERCILEDIQDIKSLINGNNADERFPPHVGLNALVNEQKVDVIIGGPPCQAYSVAGRIRDENGMHEDYRNYLFESYMAVVDHFKPAACIFENVPGMLSAAPGGVSIIDRISAAFRKSGYDISSDFKGQATLDVSEFGVPQKRKRVIIAAFRRDIHKDSTEVVNAFYSNLSLEKTPIIATVNDAIGGLPKLYPKAAAEGRKSHAEDELNLVTDHEPRFHSQRDIEIFEMLAEDIASGRNKYTSSDALKALYTEKTGKKSAVHKYYVLRESKPSNTIPAHLYKDGLRHIHPDPKQARSITVREAACLQSFDLDFLFKGPNGSKYKMIGNAVPPLFAKKIGKALNSVLDTK